MTTLRFAFEDSEVAGVTADGSLLRVRFSAASVTRAEAGARPEPGHVGGLELCCDGARWQGDLPGAIGRLSGGSVEAGGQALTQLDLPAGLRPPDPLVCELRFRQGHVLRIEAAALRIALPGDLRWAESFAC